MEKLLENLHDKAISKVQEDEKTFYDEVEIKGILASVKYHIDYFESPYIEIEDVTVASEDKYFDSIASYVSYRLEDELEVINKELTQSVKHQYAY